MLAANLDGAIRCVVLIPAFGPGRTGGSLEYTDLIPKRKAVSREQYHSDQTCFEG